MSDAVFPTLKGITWPVIKTPAFKTIIQQAVSGKEKRIALQSYPRWSFQLPLGCAEDTGATTGDYQTLLGFVLARQGAYDDFLFQDADDHTFTNQLIGTGDGVTKSFQMVRSYAGFVEPILGILDKPTMTISSSPTTAFTVSTKGIATFTDAPASNAPIIAVAGSFYYRVRFDFDSLDLQEEFSKIWTCQSINLISVK